MSGAIDRLRARRAYERGLDALTGDVGTGGAPSLPLEAPDYGPTPAQLREVARSRVDKELSPRPAPWAPQEGQGFLMREAFAGIPWWGVIFGGLSVVTLGAGVHFILSD